MKHDTPTLIWTDAPRSTGMDVFSARERKRQKVAEARAKGREALKEERELRQRLGITWSPF